MNKTEWYDLMNECKRRHAKWFLEQKVREFAAFFSGVDGGFVLSYVKRFEQS